MAVDRSGGYEAIADKFTTTRSNVGADVVRRWAKRLPKGGAVVDVGCGSGVPVSQALVDEGLQVSGIDASPTLMLAFRQRFPNSPWACEPIESSDFFGQSFDAAAAIGLLFLLPEEAQRRVVLRISEHVRPSGRFLFSAPQQACSWTDTLTGRPSASLGAEIYESILEKAGLYVASGEVDEGGNYYLDAVRGQAEVPASHV